MANSSSTTSTLIGFAHMLRLEQWQSQTERGFVGIRTVFLQLQPAGVRVGYLPRDVEAESRAGRKRAGGRAAIKAFEDLLALARRNQSALTFYADPSHAVLGLQADLNRAF